MKLTIFNNWGKAKSAKRGIRKDTALAKGAALVLVSWPLLNPLHATAGSWTRLPNNAPGAVELMLLLSDGTVLAANNDDYTIGNAWYRLTPDSHGSYVNGSWTTVASMNDSRLWYSSAVLQDGRVFVAGGEYGTGKSTAEVYDPQANQWTRINPPTTLLDPNQSSAVLAAYLQQFYDADSKILPNGNVLVAPVLPKVYGGTLIYSPASNTWSAGPTYYRGGWQDEASWVKLPDDSILTVDPYGINSERYIPSLNQWVNDANLPVALYDPYGSEMGAGILLPNGKAIFFGATGHTAIYTPSGNATPGSWAAGPDIPNSQGTPDAPAAMMVNGKILMAVSATPTSANHFPAPASFYEYDYSVGSAGSFTQVGSPTGGLTDSRAPWQSLMLDLPDGSVLYSHAGTDLYVYQPTGSALASGKPTILSIVPNPDGSFHLTGMLLNGISEGAAYGDDAQMNSNYPLVRFTDANGNVYYARTYNWSSTGVMTGNAQTTTEFALPPGLPAQPTFSVVVVANGISSDPIQFTLPPVLTITRSGPNVILSWPSSATGFTLESATSLNAQKPWAVVPQAQVSVGTRNQVTLPAAQSMQLFRLISQ